MEIQWSLPVWMWPLLLIVAAGAVAWTVTAYRQTRPAPSRRLRRGLATLRAAVLLLLALAAAGPVLSQLRRQTSPAELVVVVEDSASMALGATAPADPAATPPTRWQRALAAVAQLDSLFATRDPAVEVVLLRGNGLEAPEDFRLADPVIPQPGRHGTSLATLVEQVRSRTLGRAGRAVVLLSDGQETGARPGARGFARRGRRARTPSASGLPVFVLGVGDEHGPADRVIKDLRYPDTAYQKDEVTVEFSVDHRYVDDGRNEPLIVTLDGPGGTVASDTLDVSDTLVPVELVFAPSEPGLQAYRLQVSPLDNERFLDNNATTLAVDVRKERARVLLLAPRPDWDVRFLTQAAAREQRLELAVVYRAAAGLVFADSLTTWRLPTSAADWRSWDAVVVTDWQGPLAEMAWDQLTAAVREGLGLLVLPGGGGAGPIAFPPPDALAEALPVDPQPWRWERGSFFGELTGETAGHPVLDGVTVTGSGVAERLLAGLPPLRAWANATVRADAELLVTVSTRGSDADPRRRPLLVAGRHGQGRVAWFGGRQLWEWAFWDGGDLAEGEQPARRLLRNLLVWLAVGVDEAGLAFSGRQTLFQEGEPLRLAAQWRDLRGRPVTDRGMSVVIQQSGASVDTVGRTFASNPSVATPGLAEVQLPPLPPGTYSARLMGQGEPPVLEPETNLIVAGTSVERAQVRLDRRRLEQLAARHGGVFAVADSGALPADWLAALEAQDWTGQTSERRRRVDFWSGWPFLGLITLLLAGESFLRRRHGLL